MPGSSPLPARIASMVCSSVVTASSRGITTAGAISFIGTSDTSGRSVQPPRVVARRTLALISGPYCRASRQPMLWSGRRYKFTVRTTRTVNRHCTVPGFEAAQRLMHDEQPRRIHEHILAAETISRNQATRDVTCGGNRKKVREKVQKYGTWAVCTLSTCTRAAPARGPRGRARAM